MSQFGDRQTAVSSGQLLDLIRMIEKEFGRVVYNQVACKSLVNDVLPLKQVLEATTEPVARRREVHVVLVRLREYLSQVLQLIGVHTSERKARKLRASLSYSHDFISLSRNLAGSCELLKTACLQVVSEQRIRMDPYFCAPGGWFDQHAKFYRDNARPPQLQAAPPSLPKPRPGVRHPVQVKASDVRKRQEAKLHALEQQQPPPTSSSSSSSSSSPPPPPASSPPLQRRRQPAPLQVSPCRPTDVPPLDPFSRDQPAPLPPRDAHIYTTPHDVRLPAVTKPSSPRGAKPPSPRSAYYHMQPGSPRESHYPSPLPVVPSPRDVYCPPAYPAWDPRQPPAYFDQYGRPLAVAAGYAPVASSPYGYPPPGYPMYNTYLPGQQPAYQYPPPYAYPVQQQQPPSYERYTAGQTEAKDYMKYQTPTVTPAQPQPSSSRATRHK